jgi:plasmid stabilization system protein ParE
MKYTIDVSPKVNNELFAALDYISSDLYSPQAAENHLAEFERTLELLEENPYIRPLVRYDYLADKGFRSIMVKKYYVFYTVDKEAGVVNLIRFIHSRRDWASIVSESV